MNRRHRRRRRSRHRLLPPPHARIAAVAAGAAALEADATTNEVAVMRPLAMALPANRAMKHPLTGGVSDLPAWPSIF